MLAYGCHSATLNMDQYIQNTCIYVNYLAEGSSSDQRRPTALEMSKKRCMFFLPEANSVRVLVKRGNVMHHMVAIWLGTQRDYTAILNA